MIPSIYTHFGRRTYGGAATYTHIELNGDGREDLVYPQVGASGAQGLVRE